MKDKIFIAWSGSNDIACQVQQMLEKLNYKCYIGGNANNDSSFSSVGDTVIRQIKDCNQAIVIFQNRKDGMISNNLFFELGYVLARYGQKKIHCVKLMGDQIVLPSDFDNSFVEEIAVTEESSFADGIVNYFIKRQKMSVDTNKMYLIDNRYIIKDKLTSHYSEAGSKCSDYELAQYLLFYLQAANMFGDVDRVREEIAAFKQMHHHEFSPELLLSVNMNLAFYDLYDSVKHTPEGDFYIDRTAFRRFKETYESLASLVNDDETGTFDEWANVFITSHFTYAYSLFGECPDNTPQMAEYILKNTLVWADKTMEAIDRLQKVAPIVENNDHIGIISLIKSYVYRNKFLCSIKLGTDDKLKWLQLTRAERANLKQNFQAGSIDSKLHQNFLMEYYLTLSECISYADELGIDEFEVMMCKDEIQDYLNDVNQRSDVSKYIYRIQSLTDRA